MKKTLKYIIGVVVLLVLAYNSIYFKKLDEVKASSSGFDAKAYASEYFRNKLMPVVPDAIALDQLLTLLQNNKEETFAKYSHALGIGNIRYFLVRGEGAITAVNENDVSVLLKADSSHTIFHIATEFVFGNAIRDASGQIDVNEFRNTMDFNNVSAEINKIVRAEVLPPFKQHVKKGDMVQFAGAIELNKEHLTIKDIEVMPVQLKIAHP